MLLGYPNQFPMGNGMGPVSTPTKGFLPQYSTFAPVVGSPNRGGVGAPLLSVAVAPLCFPQPLAEQGSMEIRRVSGLQGAGCVRTHLSLLLDQVQPSPSLSSGRPKMVDSCALREAPG